MSLPKIQNPIFELKIPSRGKIHFRPFLVKEEKILLIAKESSDGIDVTRAIKQVINNCVQEEDFDVDDIPLFEMEYIFIKLRAKSINNIIEAQVVDSTDKKTYDIEVNLDDIELKKTKGHTNKIKIKEGYLIEMKYPSPKLTEVLSPNDSAIEANYKMIKESIEFIFKGDEVFPWKEATEEEQAEFIDNLSHESFEKILNFFITMPKIEHEITYTNSKGEEKRVLFKDLSDFFDFA